MAATPGATTIDAVAPGATSGSALPGSGSDPPTVADQLVTVLTPLQATAGGMHTVTLGLQPEGLGTVQATVSAGAQQINVSLWAATSDGHAALTQALAQLHNQLADDSTRSVTVELAPFGSHQPGGQAGHGGQSSPQHSSRPLVPTTQDTPDTANLRLLPENQLSGTRTATIDLRL